jgi:hypothetical protein
MQENISLACSECKRRNYTTDEEQEDEHGEAGAGEVLPVLSQAHRP